MRWEYLVKDIVVATGREGACEAQIELDALGEEGWELVDVFLVHRSIGEDDQRLFLKRQLA